MDEASGLKGECDFVFSLSRVQDFISAPIFCITEAKKQDLEQGTVQCTAQLLGARKLNELEGNPPLATLYGCSTTGIEWRFLKLTDRTVTLDEDRYLITDLVKLLAYYSKFWAKPVPCWYQKIKNTNGIPRLRSYHLRLGPLRRYSTLVLRGAAEQRQ